MSDVHTESNSHETHKIHTVYNTIERGIEVARISHNTVDPRLERV